MQIFRHSDSFFSLVVFSLVVFMKCSKVCFLILSFSWLCSFLLCLSGTVNLFILFYCPMIPALVNLNSPPNTFFLLGSIFRWKFGWLFWDFIDQNPPNSSESRANTCSHLQIGHFTNSHTSLFKLLLVSASVLKLTCHTSPSICCQFWVSY